LESLPTTTTTTPTRLEPAKTHNDHDFVVSKADPMRIEESKTACYVSTSGQEDSILYSFRCPLFSKQKRYVNLLNSN
jgi:hypothetical protein